MSSFPISSQLNTAMLFSVVTVNDYLAQRDAEWMGRVHRFLGFTVGLIQVLNKPIITVFDIPDPLLLVWEHLTLVE